jgi:hypothetical protein
MLKLSGTLLNIPVMSLRTGGQIAIARIPIINPHNLKILGWWCNEPTGKQSILLAEDVREAMPSGLAVNNEEALSEKEDLVRHKEILGIKFDLINKPVKTKRHKIGKVSQQILEVTDHYILVRDTEVRAGASELAPAGAVLGT